MDPTAMFDALSGFAPGGEIKPERAPQIDALATCSASRGRSGSPATGTGRCVEVQPVSPAETDATRNSSRPAPT